MKKIITLLVILAGIIGIAYFQKNARNSRLNRVVSSIKMRELLFPDFDINGIRKVHVKEDKSESTLTVQNDTWVIAERSDYPINKEKLQTALMSLQFEKIKAGRRLGKEAWGKIGVNSPGDAAAKGVGTLVELSDDKGVVKYSFVLGGNVSSSGGANDQMKMFGGSSGNRFVRIKDDDVIWEIGDQLSDLAPAPDAWLDKSFVDVQKLKSVEVTSAKPEDSWKAARADEAGDFILEGAGPGEKIDSGKVSLGTLLSSPTFNDVLPKDKAAAIMKDAVKVKLITFDGFTYNLQVVKQAGQGAGDKYYLTVSVSADLPKERAAVKDEKPEDKKKNDEAFAEVKKAQEEKLANEKRVAGWVYEVTEYTVSSLLKKRAEILEAPQKQEAPAAGGSAGPATSLPDIKKMIPGLNLTPAPAPATPSLPPATSSIPEAPKPEIKPAPAPDASPITGEKPAQPAKPVAAPQTSVPAKPATDSPK